MAQHQSRPTVEAAPAAARWGLVWFSVVGGMAAYAAHLMVTYWFLERCIGPSRLITALFTVVAGAVALAATLAGLRAVRSLRTSEPTSSPGTQGTAPAAAHRRSRLARGLLLVALLRRPPGRTRTPLDRTTAGAWDPAPEHSQRWFLALAGTGLSALSLGILVLIGLATVVVPPCV